MVNGGKRSIHSAGYIKLYRKVLDSPVFADAGLLKVFLWCLMRASNTRRFWNPQTGRGHTVVEVLPRRVNLVERPFRWRNDRLSQNIDDQISADFSVNQTLA